MTLRYLVLFDIDGTLLWSDGSGREAMRRALVQVYGTSGPVDNFAFAGRTDSAIVHGLLRAAGLAPAVIDDKFDDLSLALEDELRTGLASGEHYVRPCPGVPELVHALAARDDVLLGLLTGNMETTARLKLEAAGYDPDVFRLGAFGDESPERARLVTLAVQRALEMTDVTFSGKQIVIIGDTPADITCGEALGVRTVGVLTGPHTRAELEAASADVIFDDLTDTRAVLHAALAS